MLPSIMDKELLLPSRITEAMRIALSGLVDDESDEDDIVVRRNNLVSVLALFVH